MNVTDEMYRNAQKSFKQPICGLCDYACTNGDEWALDSALTDLQYCEGCEEYYCRETCWENHRC
jgi:hypothetical protein